MNTELTQLIERYLQHELPEADRAVFQARMEIDPELKRQVDAQQQVHEAAKRAAQRTQIQQTAKSYHLKKALTAAAIIIAVVATAALATWMIISSGKGKTGGISEQQLEVLKERLKDELPIAHLEAQYFQLQPKDTVLLSNEGVLLSIPDAAFLLNGKPYTGPKVVQWQEAVDASSIVKSGLSTMSGDRLLETQGMFSMQAFTPEGKMLTVDPKVGVYVQVPVDELKADMQLFEGVTGKSGLIDWQNPKPLEKLPVLADMKDLDFYPPGYEPELDKLKWKQGKKERDSLYVSFEEEELIPVLSMPAQPYSEDVVPSTSAKNSNDSPNTSFTSGQLGMSDFQSAVKELQNYSLGRSPGAKTKRNFTGTVALLSQLEVGYSLDVSCKMLDERHARLLIKGEFNINERLKQTSKGDFLSLVSDNYEMKVAHLGTKQTLGTLRNNVEAMYVITLGHDNDIYTTRRLNYTYDPSGYGGEGRISLNFVRDYPVSDSLAISDGIPPTKVLAFWKPKFNNTILSTRDFEKRMRAVHGTCSRKVLEAYTGNLNKKLYEIDEQVAAMGYPEFNEFALERVGGVEISNPHMNNLRHFYEESIAKLKEQVKRDRNYIRKLEKEWDQSVAGNRKNEVKRTEKREADALEQEYQLNLKDVYRQLGKKTVGFQIHGGGTVYNIDKYVKDATVARKSTVITDPDTGKRAEIIYNDFTLQVKNANKYDRLFLYLFPHQLNSFQRIDPIKGGRFNYPLNNIITYDVAIVGMTDKGFFYYEAKNLNKGDLGEIVLKEVSETEFDAAIEALNKGRNDKPMTVREELDWLLVEQKNYKVQKERRAMAAFREQIRGVVFPCISHVETISVDEYEIDIK